MRVLVVWERRLNFAQFVVASTWHEVASLPLLPTEQRRTLQHTHIHAQGPSPHAFLVCVHVSLCLCVCTCTLLPVCLADIIWMVATPMATWVVPGPLPVCTTMRGRSGPCLEKSGGCDGCEHSLSTILASHPSGEGVVAHPVALTSPCRCHLTCRVCMQSDAGCRLPCRLTRYIPAYNCSVESNAFVQVHEFRGMQDQVRCEQVYRCYCHDSAPGLPQVLEVRLGVLQSCPYVTLRMQDPWKALHLRQPFTHVATFSYFMLMLQRRCR